ncbi:uncharacterized protein C8Q71DRAFT_164684 [Rhodofomes roseus]|uniref:Uncharacterized protein n=1 Tax=Rhodofomes roseus TaxID=34475 RepID=A0ABQ8K9Y5_9APHY|nr:uncharacterized protein C8Q71DRAFT_164684 [Rhodofomes roseus]KAH9834168.1 hypothetical protein C8Q71DRAFT_164684 [Rhodofomes roseus]
MVHSPSSRNITRKAKHGQACPHKQHIVNEEAPPIMGVRTAMLQNDFVKDDGECACICPSMLAASNHEPSDVSCHATRVPSVTTLLDIEVEPGGAQNILVPDRAIGPSPTASSNPTHSIYERACIYDPPFCNVAPPVPSCTHGATLVARDAQPTIVKLDNLVMHNAGSQTLQTLAATSTTSSPGVGSIVGPLLGGLLGGFFGLILIVAALWYIWTSRHRLLNRQDTMESQTAPVSPNFEYKRPDRSSRRQSTLSSVPTPMPYQYGVVGRPRSQLSMTMTNTSSPHSPDPTRSRSRSHSPGPSVLTYSRPPSMTMNMMGPPSPTPAGINTPISPGPSLAPSSRPPTPGPGAAISYPPPLQQYHSDWQQQQQQARISWPQMSHSEDGHGADARRSPVLRPHSERRPSRLSLTLANWNPETDGILGELAGGGMPVARSGEAGAVASTACSTTAVGSSREGGGGGDLDAEASQETLTPANPGPGNPPRRGS